MNDGVFSRWYAEEVTQRRQYAASLEGSDPVVVAWRGRQLRVRHDDPHLGPNTPRGAVIRCAVELATDVDGLRLAWSSTVGDRYRIRVSDDGSAVGLWLRRARA